MQIQVSTDNHISGNDELIRQTQATVEDALGRFGDRLTRVEVFLKDANSHKGGDADKHCTMEARPTSHQPITVTHAAATLEDAIEGAADKLRKTLDRTFDKLDDRKGQVPYGGVPGSGTGMA